MIGSNLRSDIQASTLGVGTSRAQDPGTDASSESGLDFADILSSQGTQDEGEMETESADGLAELDTLDLSEMAPPPQLSHQIAMLTFMSQMKSEFNIEPEKIVDAFTQLKPEDLARPAAENIQKIISQLGIPVEQQPKACAELEEMLKITEADDDDTELLAPVPLTHDALIARMNMAQMQPPAAPQSAAAAMKQTQHQPTEDRKSGKAAPLAFDVGASAGIGAGIGAAAAGLAAKGSEISTPVDMNGSLSAKKFNLADVTKQVSTPSSDLSAATSKAKVLNVENQNSGIVVPQDLQVQSEILAQSPIAIPSPIEPKAAEPTVSAASAATAATAGTALAGGVAAGKMLFGGDDESSEKSDKEESASLAAQGYMADGASSKNANELSNAGFKLDAKNPIAPQDTNLKEVIGQAQFLAKKGGGEMKVQLRPDGLGEVSMSVKVQDGQVSVQLITESGDAKKLLENGLSDLKTSLQSHQLDLGTFKVDVSRDASSQMDHHREQAGRQHAQGMLEDFRGQQGNQRQYATPEQMVARSAYRAPARESISSGYSPAMRGSSASSASRRLDLVA